MRLDLLWWRHLRAPREHVADPQPLFNYTVTDMSKMIYNLSHPLFGPSGTWIATDAEVAPGAYFEHEGRWHKAIRVYQSNADDWFAPAAWNILVEEPVSIFMHRGWLEDELFPRLSAKIEWMEDKT